MRGAFYRVFLDTGSWLDVQVSFEDAPAGLCWMTHGYDQYEVADYNTAADFTWMREIFEFMAYDWMLVPLVRFAGFLPIDPDPGRPFRSL